MYCIGLDIGGTKCAVLLAHINHGIHIVDKIRFLTQASRGFEPVYADLCRSMEEILNRNGKSFADIHSIGISCGGPLDAGRGLVLSPPNLPGWDEIPLPEMLSKKYGVPAFIQNDANACAMVEWKLGAGRGTQNMIFLTMGTGMGAGVIAEGKLLNGFTYMGGEVGHMRLTNEGPVGFGKAGSFEGYTSGGGIGRQAVALTRKLIERGTPPQWSRDGHEESEISAKLMAEYAKAGDEDALAFFGEIGRMLGRGLALLVDAFNPERIVIGSIFMRCEELLRPTMEEELKKEAIGYSLKGMQVLPAATGEQLGDLASVMVSLYAMDIDPMAVGEETDERVLAHYRRLLERYPALESCATQILKAYDILRTCYQSGHKLMLAGNGGSCADCAHIAGELMKGFRLRRPLPADLKERLRKETAPLLPEAAELLQQGLPAINLMDSPALSTAVLNDLNPLLCAAQQVVGYGQPGDVVLGISTSGNAKNVALALSTARAMGMHTIALTGGTGGLIAQISECAIVVPERETAFVQELHLPVYHALCSMIEAKFFEE